MQPCLFCLHAAELEARAQQEYLLIKWHILTSQQRTLQTEWEGACAALRTALGLPHSEWPSEPGGCCQQLKVRWG